MLTNETALRWFQREARSLERQQSLLETGEIRNARFVRGGQWSDTTATDIRRIDARLSELQSLATSLGLFDHVFGATSLSKKAFGRPRAFSANHA